MDSQSPGLGRHVRWLLRADRSGHTRFPRSDDGNPVSGDGAGDRLRGCQESSITTTDGGPRWPGGARFSICGPGRPVTRIGNPGGAGGSACPGQAKRPAPRPGQQLGRVGFWRACNGDRGALWARRRAAAEATVARRECVLHEVPSAKTLERHGLWTDTVISDNSLFQVRQFLARDQQTDRPRLPRRSFDEAVPLQRQDHLVY